MSLLVKICGVKTESALDAALAAGADQFGLVFFPASPRAIDVAAARALRARASGRAEAVALTVDADDALLETIVREIAPDVLQLHGHETPERVTELRQRFGLPVGKAVPISEAADLSRAAAYERVADRLLFDARPPRGATRPGGLGAPFDWHLLAGYRPKVPFMLSGGLDAGNVAQALAIVAADGVDVSSGVERAPGEKDPEMIAAFVRAARVAAASETVRASAVA